MNRNTNSNDIPQKQNNCISAVTDIRSKLSDYQNEEYNKSDDLINKFISINSDSEGDSKQSLQPPAPPARRFTRKQLLSRPVNRKERLLYCNNASLASSGSSPPLPPPRAGAAGGESCSCTLAAAPPAAATAAAAAAEKQPRPPVAKVSSERRTPSIPSSDASSAGEDDDGLSIPGPRPPPSPSPSPPPSLQEEDDQISDHKIIDLKSVHFSADLDDEEISRGVQVTPPQFRLRFVPQLKWTCSVRGFCLLVVRVLASQMGLTIFLLVWTLLGAAAFHATEGEREAGLANELRLLEGRLAMDLATELRQAAPDHHSAWWRILERGVRHQEEALAEAISAGYSANGGTIWNYAGSLLFAVTMLTTIGFGAPVPRTPLGRTSAVIYSAVSIPLHLLLVVNFGALVADKLEYCVRCMRRRRQRRRRRAPLEGEINASEDLCPPWWFSWLPVLAIVFYYMFGIMLFGGAPLFPLDFTTAGGVGQRSSTLRTIYAVYLECAVILAGISVNVWRNTASSGFITLGLRLDLLARGREYS